MIKWFYLLKKKNYPLESTISTAKKKKSKIKTPLNQPFELSIQ